MTGREMLLPKTYQAQISQNLKLTSRVHKIVLELVEPKTIEFTAGQFLMFQVSETVKRAYSIASTPEENTRIELFIDISPGGPASKYISSVTEGTSCTFMAPYGQFVLRDTPNDKIFVAGSTGLAPIRSMIKNYLSRLVIPTESGEAGRVEESFTKEFVEKDPSAPPPAGGVARDDIKIILYFGVNMVEELFLVEEFKELEKKFANFKYIPVVATPEKEWEGEKGLVTEPLLREFGGGGGSGGFEGKDFYICGSPNMVHAVRQQLLDKGVGQEKIFNERF